MATNTEQGGSEQIKYPVYALLGFMGSGKSTLGRQIAAELQRPFLDLDSLLEEKEGMSIAQIFAQKGEAYFRKLESDMLANTLRSAQQGSILSVGGGAPCFHDNMKTMNEYATTVFLDVSAKALAIRLEPNRQERPLISNLSPEGFLSWIEEKLSERRHWYAQAEVVLSGDHLTKEDLLQLIHWRESGFLR
ncbi:MAG: shikimate kinase [Bacteroidia bacterium]|nr:shikimate kinase [Bacteroidia bacterium]